MLFDLAVEWTAWLFVGNHEPGKAVVGRNGKLVGPARDGRIAQSLTDPGGGQTQSVGPGGAGIGHGLNRPRDAEQPGHGHGRAGIQIAADGLQSGIFPLPPGAVIVEKIERGPDGCADTYADPLRPRGQVKPRLGQGLPGRVQSQMYRAGQSGMELAPCIHGPRRDSEDRIFYSTSEADRYGGSTA